MSKVRQLAHDVTHIRGKQMSACSGVSRAGGQMRRREAPGQGRAKVSDIPPHSKHGETRGNVKT